MADVTVDTYSSTHLLIYSHCSVIRELSHFLPHNFSQLNHAPSSHSPSPSLSFSPLSNACVSYFYVYLSLFLSFFSLLAQFFSFLPLHCTDSSSLFFFYLLLFFTLSLSPLSPLLSLSPSPPLSLAPPLPLPLSSSLFLSPSLPRLPLPLSPLLSLSLSLSLPLSPSTYPLPHQSRLPMLLYSIVGTSPLETLSVSHASRLLAEEVPKNLKTENEEKRGRPAWEGVEYLLLLED